MQHVAGCCATVARKVGRKLTRKDLSERNMDRNIAQLSVVLNTATHGGYYVPHPPDVAKRNVAF